MTLNSGNCAIMNFWVALIPTSKVSITNAIFGVPFERSVKYHKLIVHVAMVWALVHLLANYTANTDIMYSSEVFGGAKIVPVYGVVAFILFCTMSLLAFEPIRRAQYDIFVLFHNLHWFGVLFIILHVKSDGSLPAAGFIPGLLLQFADACIKIYALAFPVPAFDCVLFGTADDEITHLSFPLHNSGSSASLDHFGQYFLVNIQSVSFFAWHPFSISHVDRVAGAKVHFHIKNMGKKTWTGQLAEKVRGRVQIKASLNGPYGNLSLDLNKYQCILLFAGGIGVTPMAHTLETIAHIRNKRSSLDDRFQGLHSLRFVWAVRDLSLVEVFNARLSSVLNMSASSHSSSRLYLETNSPLVHVEEPTDVELELTGLSLNEHERADRESKRIDFRNSESANNTSRELNSYIRIDIYETQKPSSHHNLPSSTSLHPSITIHRGRPNVSSIIKKSRVEFAAQDGGRTCALVCGPAPLSASVVSVCVTEGVDSHREVFSL